MKKNDPQTGSRTNNVSNLTNLPHGGAGAPGSSANPEIRDLGTQFAGAVHLHETRYTQQPVIIDEPDSPNPGPYDVRTGKYEVQKNPASTLDT